MFKGIIALFASKAIWNFKTLLGIIFGIFCALHFTMEEIIELYSSYYPYALFTVLSLFYNLFLKPPYKPGGREFDYGNFTLNFLMSIVQMVFVSYLAVSFFYMMAIG